MSDRIDALGEMENGDDSEESGVDEPAEPEPEPESEPKPEPESAEGDTDQTDREDNVDSSESTDSVDSQPGDGEDSAGDADETGDEDNDSENGGTLEEPAFTFKESKQSPIYARPETWDLYDDAGELSLERRLRDHGVRNVQKRELHDAALRMVAEDTERWCELILEARREQ